MEENMVVGAMVRLDEDRVINLVKSSVENGVAPLEIIEEIRQGMIKVVQLYEQGKYFLADLMMSSEIFKDVIELLKADSSMYEKIDAPPIIIGTVKNDIHDIGKNMMSELLQCKGYKVVDLGIDVPPKSFVQAAVENSSKIVCMSGLLTGPYDDEFIVIKPGETVSLQHIYEKNMKPGNNVMQCSFGQTGVNQAAK